MDMQILSLLICVSITRKTSSPSPIGRPHGPDRRDPVPPRRPGGTSGPPRDAGSAGNTGDLSPASRAPCERPAGDLAKLCRALDRPAARAPRQGPHEAPGAPDGAGGLQDQLELTRASARRPRPSVEVERARRPE